MKSVLISGGAGFIGSHLADALLKRNYRVTVLDNFSAQIHGNHQDELTSSLSGDVRVIRGDVRSREDWRRALSGQEIVVHLAAETGTGQSMYQIERYIDVNVRGTATLLDILANERHHVAKMLLASSRAVYGEGKYQCEQHGTIYPAARIDLDLEAGDFSVKCPLCLKEAAHRPTGEDGLIQPTSVYGISKYSQEILFMRTARSLGIPAAALRYQNVFGPGQSLHNPYTGILSIFSSRIRNGLPIYVFEDGRETRDFVYVDDVVESTRLAIESPAADFEIFNVGAGRSIEVLSLAQQLCSALNGTSPIEINGRTRVGDIRHSCADIGKISAALGYSPRFSFAEGIRLFAAWVDKQPLLPDRLQQSIVEMEHRGLYK